MSLPATSCTEERPRATPPSERRMTMEVCTARLHGLAVTAADGVGDDDVCAECDADEQIQRCSPMTATVCADSGHGDRAQLTPVKLPTTATSAALNSCPENAGRRDRKGVARELAPERPVEHVHMPLFGHCLHNFLTFFFKTCKNPKTYHKGSAAGNQDQICIISYQFAENLIAFARAAAKACSPCKKEDPFDSPEPRSGSTGAGFGRGV